MKLFKLFIYSNHSGLEQLEQNEHKRIILVYVLLPSAVFQVNLIYYLLNMLRTYLDVFVVEYSLKQQSFNVLPIKDMVRKNCRMITEHKKSNDYLVIGVARTREEADSVISYFQQQLEQN